MAIGYNKRKLGGEKEQLAGEFLERQGYQILEYNFYSRWGEIDIVAREDDYYVFLEVKYRSSDRNGFPEEAVGYGKMQHMTKAAQYYLLRHGLPEDTPCRLDVVAILGRECHLIRDAFEAV